MLPKGSQWTDEYKQKRQNCHSETHVLGKTAHARLRTCMHVCAYGYIYKHASAFTQTREQALIWTRKQKCLTHTWRESKYQRLFILRVCLAKKSLKYTHTMCLQANLHIKYLPPRKCATAMTVERNTQQYVAQYIHIYIVLCCPQSIEADRNSSEKL